MRYGVYQYANNNTTLSNNTAPSTPSTPAQSKISFEALNPLGVGDFNIFHNGDLKVHTQNYDFPGYTDANTSFKLVLALPGTGYYTYLDNIALYTYETRNINIEDIHPKFISDEFAVGKTIECVVEENNNPEISTVFCWYEGKNENSYPKADADWILAAETSNSFVIANDNKYVKCVIKQMLDNAVVREYTCTMFKPQAPYAENLTIQKHGSILKASYDYFDANSDLEEKSLLLWYESPDKEEWSLIKQAEVSHEDVASDFTLDAEGKENSYIKCVLTVKSQHLSGDNESLYTGETVEAYFIEELQITNLHIFSDRLVLDLNKAADIDSVAEGISLFDKESGEKISFVVKSEDNKSITLSLENALEFENEYVLTIDNVFDASKKTAIDNSSYMIKCKKLYQENFDNYDSETFRSKYPNDSIEYDADKKRAKLVKDNNSYKFNADAEIENKKPLIIEFDAQTVQGTRNEDPKAMYLDVGFGGLYSTYANLRYGVYQYANNLNTLSGNSAPAVPSAPCEVKITFETQNPLGVGDFNIYHNQEVSAHTQDYDFPGYSSSNNSFRLVLALPGAGYYTYLDNIVMYTYECNSIKPKNLNPRLVVNDFSVGNTVNCVIEENDDPDISVVYCWYEGKYDNAYPQNDKEWVLTSETSNSYVISNDNRYVRCVTMQKLGKAVLKEYNNIVFKPVVPTAKSISINRKNDATLEASYDYFDANGDLEEKSVLVWYESTDKKIWTPIKQAEVSHEDASSDFSLDVTNKTDLFVKCVLTVKSQHSSGDSVSDYTGTSVEALFTLPFKPVATNVKITGNTNVGAVLVADYDYYDENGDLENEELTEKIWYRLNNGNKVPIGTGLTYYVQSADAGEKLLFEVIPKNNEYPENTIAYTSNELAISGSSTKITGGSSGGGGSSDGGFASSSIPQYGNGNTQKADNNFVYIPEPLPLEIQDIAGHWAENSIKTLYDKGLIYGRGNGFEPDSSITRSEWLALLYRSVGSDTDSLQFVKFFKDVQEGEWYANIIADAYKKGLISGTDGQFEPNKEITREQLAKMLVDMYEYYTGNPIEQTVQLDFVDNDDISPWAAEYVKKAVCMKFIVGNLNHEFCPLNTATRAEAATVLLKFINSL